LLTALILLGAEFNKLPEPTSMLQSFATLDLTIQGALIGASSAIAATVLTVLVTAFVTWLQLRSARIEREKDRKLELKKDVLFQATQGVSQCMSVIGLQSNIEIPDDVLSGRFSEGSARTVLVQAVATPKTIAALNELMKKTAESYFSLLPKRMRVQALKTDADIATQNVERNLDRQKILIAQHHEAILDGSDARRVGMLQAMLDHSFEEFESSSKDRDKKSNALTSERIRFVPECIASQLSLSEAHRQFVLAVRVETGISKELDEAFLAATLINQDEALSVLKEGLKPLQDELEADVAEQEKNVANEQRENKIKA